MKRFLFIFLLALMSWMTQAQQTNKTPILRGFLQSDFDGNTKLMTNLGAMSAAGASMVVSNASLEVHGPGNTATLNLWGTTSGGQNVSLQSSPAGLAINSSVNAGSITSSGTISGTHSGDGSALTALNGSQVTSGTIGMGRLDPKVVTNNAATSNNRLQLGDGGRGIKDAAASGAVPVDADGSAATSTQVNALFPGTVHTNGMSVSATFSNTVAIDATHQLFVSNATASRVILSDANKGLISAAASGAVPIDADGSAATAAQIVATGLGNAAYSNANAFVWSNAGNGTNTTFQGTIGFNAPIAIYGAPYTFWINTNRGPAFDPYNGYARLLGGEPNGIQVLNYNGSVQFMTMGLNPASSRTENVVRTPIDSGTIQNASGIDECYGSAINTCWTYMGGNAAAVTGLPLNGPEISIRLPTAPAVFYPMNIVQGSSNFCTENYITNLVQQSSVRAIKSVYTNWGIPVWVETEGWMSTSRDANGNLQTLSSQYPDPIGWICRYCHTNGFGFQLHVGWSSRISPGVASAWPFDYQSMTPQTVNRDIVFFYTNGIDAIRVADGLAGDLQSAVGYVHQMQRCIADKLLFPNGFLWSAQNGYTNPIAFDCFIQDPTRTGLVLDSAFMVNNFADDQGRGGNSAVDIAKAGYQMRLTWTNYAKYAHKGGYFSSVYVDDGYLSTPDFKALLAAQAMYPGPLSFFSNQVDAVQSAIWTNYNFLRSFTDVAQEPAWPIYDFGTNQPSAWVKPLAGGSLNVLLMNETAASSNMVVNWSQIVSPKGFAPVGTTLYPINVSTNSFYSVMEQWATNQIGILQGTMTQAIGAHSSGWYRFDPVTPTPGAVTKTANYTVVLGDLGAWINNSGAGGAVTNTLPAAIPNAQFGLSVEAAQNLAFKAAGTDTIRNAASVSAGGGLIFASTIGNMVHLRCDIAGKWKVDQIVGTWTTQ